MNIFVKLIIFVTISALLLKWNSTAFYKYYLFRSKARSESSQEAVSPDKESNSEDSKSLSTLKRTYVNYTNNSHVGGDSELLRKIMKISSRNNVRTHKVTRNVDGNSDILKIHRQKRNERKYSLVHDVPQGRAIQDNDGIYIDLNKTSEKDTPRERKAATPQPALNSSENMPKDTSQQDGALTNPSINKPGTNNNNDEVYIDLGQKTVVTGNGGSTNVNPPSGGSNNSNNSPNVTNGQNVNPNNGNVVRPNGNSTNGQNVNPNNGNVVPPNGNSTNGQIVNPNNGNVVPPNGNSTNGQNVNPNNGNVVRPNGNSNAPSPTGPLNPNSNINENKQTFVIDLDDVPVQVETNTETNPQIPTKSEKPVSFVIDLKDEDSGIQNSNPNSSSAIGRNIGNRTGNDETSVKIELPKNKESNNNGSVTVNVSTRNIQQMVNSGPNPNILIDFPTNTNVVDEFITTPHYSSGAVAQSASIPSISSTTTIRSLLSENNSTENIINLATEPAGATHSSTTPSVTSYESESKNVYLDLHVITNTKTSKEQSMESTTKNALENSKLGETSFSFNSSTETVAIISSTVESNTAGIPISSQISTSTPTTTDAGEGESTRKFTNSLTTNEVRTTTSALYSSETPRVFTPIQGDAKTTRPVSAPPEFIIEYFTFTYDPLDRSNGHPAKTFLDDYDVYKQRGSIYYHCC